MTLTAARVTVTYSGKALSGGSPQASRIDASGGVVVTRPDQRARRRVRRLRPQPANDHHARRGQADAGRQHRQRQSPDDQSRHRSRGDRRVRAASTRAATVHRAPSRSPSATSKPRISAKSSRERFPLWRAAGMDRRAPCTKLANWAAGNHSVTKKRAIGSRYGPDARPSTRSNRSPKPPGWRGCRWCRSPSRTTSASC